MQRPLDQEPEARERHVATLMHLATIPAPILAPLLVLGLYRKQPYVRAHALQAIYETLWMKVALAVLITCSFAYTISRLLHHYQTEFREFSWTEFAIRFVIGWLLLMLLGGINTIQAIFAARKASMGVWPKSGRIVRGIEGRMAGR